MIQLLKESREILTENEIATRLVYILDESSRSKRTEYPIGLMTGMKRDWWATIRDQLQEGLLHIYLLCLVGRVTISLNT